MSLNLRLNEIRFKDNSESTTFSIQYSSMGRFNIANDNTGELAQISEINFAYIYENSTILSGGHFETKGKLIRVSNKDILLLEGTEEYAAATRNSQTAKVTLKIGSKYDIRFKRMFSLFENITYNAPSNATYIGSFSIFPISFRAYAGRPIYAGIGIDKTAYIFLNEKTNELFYTVTRSHFTLIKETGLNFKYMDKMASLDTIKKDKFEAFKTFINNCEDETYVSMIYSSKKVLNEHKELILKSHKYSKHTTLGLIHNYLIEAKIDKPYNKNGLISYFLNP